MRNAIKRDVWVIKFVYYANKQSEKLMKEIYGVPFHFLEQVYGKNPSIAKKRLYYRYKNELLHLHTVCDYWFLNPSQFSFSLAVKLKSDVDGYYDFWYYKGKTLWIIGDVPESESDSNFWWK